MKGRRSRVAIGGMTALLWCVAMASWSAWRSDQPQIRWQEAASPTEWPVSRARFHWTVSLSGRSVRGAGAMLVDQEGSVQVDLLDPTYVPWARWLITSRHVAVYLLSERTHFVGYRSSEVVTDALGGQISVTDWWQQIVTGRAPSMGQPEVVVANPATGGLEVRWADPPISAVVNASDVVTSWRLEGIGTGAVVTMKPSANDVFGRPALVVFEQERPPLEISLSFLEWQDVGADVTVADPLSRLRGFEELPINELPSSLFKALLLAL